MTTAFLQVGAFALAASSKDAAVLVPVPPGRYRQVSGNGGDHGHRAVEIHEVPGAEPGRKVSLVIPGTTNASTLPDASPGSCSLFSFGTRRASLDLFFR